MKSKFLIGALALGLLKAHGATWAHSAPRPVATVAVTDLAYEERVQEYFEVARIKGTAAVSSSYGGMAGSRSSDVTYAAGAYSYLEQTELRHFMADLKGALIKGGGLKLVQGRGFDAGAPQATKSEQLLYQLQSGKAPATPVSRPSVNDIIARIKKGEFAKADFVLFGSLSSVQFRDELSPIQGTTNASRLYSLDLVADFSLINTRTYEVKAAFSAQGGGQDIKLIGPAGDVVVPQRSKVIRETSQTLAQSAYAQLLEQLGVSADAPVVRQQPVVPSRIERAPEPLQANDAPVMIFK